MICEGCYGRGAPTFAGHANWLMGSCPHCKYTGRVPRPCPPTAQPIATVRLTGERISGAERDWGEVFHRDDETFACTRYPGVTFHLPG